jgi:hypothetical protein
MVRLLLRFQFFLEKRGFLPFRCGGLVALVIAAALISLDRAEASSSPSAEHKALAAKLAGTSPAAEQDSLIDKTDPALLKGTALRVALLEVAFQRTLEGNYVEAEKVDRMIIRVGIHTHDPEMVAAGQTMVGGLLRESGDYSEGVSLLRQAWDFYEKRPGPSNEKASVSQGLGITYLYEGNFRRALASLELALKIATELHYHDAIIPALNSIGEVFRSQGQPEGRSNTTNARAKSLATTPLGTWRSSLTILVWLTRRWAKMKRRSKISIAHVPSPKRQNSSPASRHRWPSLVICICARAKWKRPPIPTSKAST